MIPCPKLIAALDIVATMDRVAASRPRQACGLTALEARAVRKAIGHTPSYNLIRLLADDENHVRCILDGADPDIRRLVAAMIALRFRNTMWAINGSVWPGPPAKCHDPTLPRPDSPYRRRSLRAAVETMFHALDSNTRRYRGDLIGVLAMFAKWMVLDFACGRTRDRKGSRAIGLHVLNQRLENRATITRTPVVPQYFRQTVPVAIDVLAAAQAMFGAPDLAKMHDSTMYPLGRPSGRA